jgi:glycosyltransferase involved in cell wall biosynthesis
VSDATNGAGRVGGMLISVVVPVFNEAATVRQVVAELLELPLRLEILLVNDGSTDDSAAVLAALGREHEQVTVLTQPANRGKGAAVRRGIAESSGEIVLIQDADLEYSPEEFPELIELICQGRADVVYGSRFLGRHRVFMFSHYVGNVIVTFFTNVLYNTMLSDMETCYKVMRTEVLRSFTLRSNGFGIEPELTAKIFKRGYRVYEIPITYDGRGYEEGKKITWRDGFVALWVLLKYRFTE